MKPFLALGDSYTIGEGVTANERWPERLASALQQERIAIEAPHIIATTGWTTGELLGAIHAQGPLPTHCGLVTVMIGVNNQYRGLGLQDFERDYAALLNIAARHADGESRRVLAISIPDWGSTPFAQKEGRDASEVANAIDTFNACAQRCAARHTIAWVDITTLTRRHAADAHLLCADGLHPSATLHGLWAGEILPFARIATAA